MKREQLFFLLIAFGLMWVIYRAFYYNDALFSARALCRKVKSMESLSQSVENTQAKSEYIRQIEGLGFSCDGTKAVTKQ